MKTWKKIVRLLVLAVILIPTATVIAVQIPAVQTALVNKVSRVLSKDLDGDIRVGKVMLSLPNNLILKDVDIIQGNSDTLAHLGKVLAGVKTSSLLFSKEAHIRRVSLEDGFVAIRHINDSTTNLEALLAPLQAKPKKESSGGMPWENIRASRVDLKHIDFTMDSLLQLQDINLRVRDIRYGETASARIESLTLREQQRRLDLQAFSANVAMDSSGIQVRNLHADDGQSDIRADVSLGFKDFSDFSDFINRVQLDADLHNTRFDTRSLRPVLQKGIPELALWLNGQVKGSVSDLQSRLLHVESASQQTRLDLKFRLRGLPDFEHARINAEILDGHTRTQDIAAILSGLQPGFRKASVSKFAPGEAITLKAKADGTLSDLKAEGTISSGTMGSATFDAKLDVLGDLLAEGKVSTESLQLGRMLGNKALGALTCQTDVRFSNSKKGFDAVVEPLRIDNFSFNGYNYHDIIASGRIKDGSLSADIMSGDPNLQLVVHGDVSLGGKKQDSRYRIDLDLDYADLHALSFDKRDSTSLSMALDADITQTPEGAFLGQADIRALQATLGSRFFDIGDLSLVSTLQDGRYGTQLESSIARADYEGNFFITEFIDRTFRLIKEDHLSPLFGAPPRKDKALHPEDFGSLHLRTLALQPLLDFFAPDLYVSRESSINIDLLGDELQGTVSSELAALGNTILRNLQGRILTEGERLTADFDADRMQSGQLVAENLQLDALADSTMLDLEAGFHNEDGSGHRARLHALASFLNLQEDGYRLRVDVLPSVIAIAGNEWETTPSTLYYKDKHIRIDDFALLGGEQSLMADGVVGAERGDTVRIQLNDLDLGLVNSFLPIPMNLQGLLNGRGEAFALLGPEKGILLDLHGHQISAGDVNIGDLRIASKWDEELDRFNFLVNNVLNGKNPLYATAWLHPADKQAALDLQLDDLQVGMLEPVLSSLFSDMSGSISGHVSAEGPLDKLRIRSEDTRFNDFKFTLNYTQADYTANGPFSVGEKGVTFDDISLTDIYGRTGRLYGGIPYDHFKDIRLNVRIDLNNNLVLNTTSRDNESFYGKAFADGTVRVSGTLDKVRLGLNVTPQRYTAIHIPLGKSARNGKSLLTFINQEEQKIGLFDSLLIVKQMVKGQKGGKGTEVNVNLRLNATPDAEIQLEIDKSTGDILKARGNGQIGITVEGERFDIKGDYQVDSGSYHFGMLGFTTRDFSINPGGTISFGGDVMQSDLDLTATYRTKASISPLMADSTAVSTRRTVDCGIGLNGKLANPEIKFTIDIPDLDPTTQSRVQSALNTEDKRMKQALALLISGGFVPDEQSGIVNNTTLLYSNASEMMSSQLNNIFRQLDIPIDLGFNYQPSDNGRDIFDVAVSTQLFNNRVSINGNIGNRQYLSSATSDIVGDLDIEIKLNRKGQLRLTLFSHSADQYSNYLDMSQRNGAGIVYQEDFNTIGDLWRKIFHIKKDDERQTIPDSDPARRLPPE
ncbi:MAG: translocation/assembly module TamB domain-containing protein [Bacteroidales bacterium]|nr:translocation/assembly module TamB domain-containing protein [Bacteroidales bacterium]